MMKFLKLILIIILLLLSGGYLVEIFEISPHLLKFPLQFQLFLYGGLTFLIFWAIFRKRFMYAFSVFEHELTHVLVAKLFFLKLFRFEVSPKKHVEGRVVVGVDGQGKITRVTSVVFSLAPYYIPTVLLLIFALSPLFGTRIRPVFIFAVGFTIMYHLLTTFLEFGFHQADIQRHGEYFSTAFVLLGNIVFFGIALIVVMYGFQHVPAFLLSGILNIFGG